MRTVVLLFATGLGLVAQTRAPAGLPPESILLARIRSHMSEMLKRQPDYTCVETIERSRRDSRTHKYSLEDTLRLEVALVSGKEMFAWPGTKHFEDKDIRDFVPTGLFGNGDFALYARSVFESSAPAFELHGTWPLQDSSIVGYDFQVRRLDSGFTLRHGEREGLVGYHGSFFADRQTLDLQSLEVTADDIPPELEVKQLTDRMQYARIPIGQGTFLLPESSEVVLVDDQGEESRNRVRFSSCREFTGESVLTFADPAPAGAAPPAAKQEIELPAGRDLTLRLDSEIDTSASAVGDEVRADLRNDVKVHGKILMPRGSVARGRITRLERYPSYTVLGLIFSELESGSAHASVKLEFDHMAESGAYTERQRMRVRPQPSAHEGLILMSA
jgi:hypothetical protein